MGDNIRHTSNSRAVVINFLIVERCGLRTKQRLI